MDLGEFSELHVPALEADEARYNLQIDAIASAVKDNLTDFRHWTFGVPGHCAIKWPGRAILLGNLDRVECQQLAEATKHIEYPGVVGADQTAHWFIQHATEMGAHFEAPLPQRIHVLSSTPRYSGVRGSPRAADIEDMPLLLEWLAAFHREAIPHDPPPERANIEMAVANRRFLLWIIDEKPVSVARIARRLRLTGAINSVYTPPQERGRGYASSVTAAVVDQLFSEGKTAACLYTDLRNPISNRCYAKVGFRPHCDSWHYLRKPHGIDPNG
jgi:RimJ/RimL family protein N-acetyltransferase